jgi:hypothetical protein
VCEKDWLRPVLHQFLSLLHQDQLLTGPQVILDEPRLMVQSLVVKFSYGSSLFLVLWTGPLNTTAVLSTGSHLWQRGLVPHCPHPMSSCSQQWLGVLSWWWPSLCSSGGCTGSSSSLYCVCPPHPGPGCHCVPCCPVVHHLVLLCHCPPGPGPVFFFIVLLSMSSSSSSLSCCPCPCCPVVLVLVVLLLSGLLLSIVPCCSLAYPCCSLAGLVIPVLFLPVSTCEQLLMAAAGGAVIMFISCLLFPTICPVSSSIIIPVVCVVAVMSFLLCCSCVVVVVSTLNPTL